MIGVGFLEVAPQMHDIKPRKSFLYLTLLYYTLPLLLISIYRPDGLADLHAH
jgi:hypothetical protein